MLEGFLFLCFTYLYLNNSQELWCGKDTLGAFKAQQFMLRPWLVRLTLVYIALLTTWYCSTLLEVDSYNTIKVSYLELTLAVAGAFELWAMYGSIQVLSSGVLTTLTDNSKLALEIRRARVSHHYLLICGLAKF